MIASPPQSRYNLDMPQKIIIVVGLGASGLMAAGTAAAAGAHVIGIDGQTYTGRKLLITGSGRCNVTNSASREDFIKAFGAGGKFLYGVFNQFFSPDLLKLLKTLGVDTVEERGGRLYPASQKSKDVRDALLNMCTAAGVELRLGQKVEQLVIEGGVCKGVLVAGKLTEADAVIVATGGKSYPLTGSVGSGYELARHAKHVIVTPVPSLVPFEVSESWVKELSGLALKNVELSLFHNGKQLAVAFGELLFTHFGVSGPIVLELSQCLVPILRQMWDSGHRDFQHWNLGMTAELNLKPALSATQIRDRLQREFDQNGKKNLGNILKTLLPSSLIPVFLKLSGMAEDKVGHQISAAERTQLQTLLTALPLTLTGLRPWEEAVVTAGGIKLKEVDPKTLESKLVSGLYFAGEVLDIQGDTGGYNLQAAFSTGYVAGHSAASQTIT